MNEKVLKLQRQKHVANPNNIYVHFGSFIDSFHSVINEYLLTDECLHLNPKPLMKRYVIKFPPIDQVTASIGF